MRSPTQSSFFLFLVTVIPLLAASPHPRLRPGYYSPTCPDAESIVRTTMRTAMIKESRSAASVMRFQFHDCFVNGCDGSVLLDDTPTMLGEKLALSNINSLRDFDVVDEIKAELEKACPGVVSCADIIVMASRDAVALSGGPDWVVKLGRLDSLTASQDNSSTIMPSPRSTAAALVELFLKYDLSPRDTVALSGSHSIGKGRCFSVMYRLYNQSGSGKPDPAIDPGYLTMLDELCPLGGDENTTGSLDSTPTKFDNRYFKDLMHGRGFLNSDQTLYTSPETRDYVVEFSKDQDAFFEAFVEGMIKLGDLVYDNPGEIRKNCRIVNDRPNDMLVVY